MRFLEGQVAIVVGGGRGIGAATARALAGEGATLLLAARTLSDLEVVAAHIRASGGVALPVTTDLGDEAQARSLVTRALDEFGKVDLLITCAAAVLPLGLPVWEIEPAELRRCLEVNVIGLFSLCQAALPAMIGNGSGRILALSSPFGEHPLPGGASYCASRAGLNQLVRTLAREIDTSGVTANLVYPGRVNTPGYEAFRSALFGDAWGGLSKRQPRQPVREPEDVARLLLWLCSPGTAGLNGATISLDDPAVRQELEMFEHRWSAGDAVTSAPYTSGGAA